jgi:hypothetical protein
MSMLPNPRFCDNAGCDRVFRAVSVRRLWRAGKANFPPG